MRTYSELVFDGAVEGTSPVYTLPRWNRLLAMTRLIELGVVATDVSGTTPLLFVRSQASPDEQNWYDKGPIEIDAWTLSTTEVTLAVGSSVLDVPTQGFVRLQIYLNGTNPKARLKIYVTGRGSIVLR